MRKCARGKAAGRPVSSPGSSTCAAAVGVGNERAARPFGPLADPPRAAIPRREQRVAGPRSPAPERVAGVAGPRRRHRPPPADRSDHPNPAHREGQCPGRSLRQERGACRYFRYRTQIGNVSGIGNRSLMYHHPIFRITQHSCRRSCQSVLRGSAPPLMPGSSWMPWNRPSISAARSRVLGWSITATVAANICRSNTLNDWPRRASSLQSAALATATTTPRRDD